MSQSENLEDLEESSRIFCVFLFDRFPFDERENWEQLVQLEDLNKMIAKKIAAVKIVLHIPL